MSETKNVVIQQNNGTDYNILYPDSNSWKKDQVAILETFQKYGLDASAVPKDLFDYLISQIKSEYGKTYWWNRWKYTYTIDMTATDSIGNPNVSASYTGTLYVAQFDSIQVTRDGTYIGNLKQVLTVKEYDEIPYGYYYSTVYKSKANAQSSKPVCYSNWDSSKGEYYSNISTTDGGKYLGVSTVCVLANVTTKIDESRVSSTNPDTYSETELPDSEGYFYGLEDVVNAPTFGQIYNSYYVGTGTAGSSSPNVITCTGCPVMVYISFHSPESSKYYNLLFVRSMEKTNSTTNNNYRTVYLIWADNSVSFYSDDIEAQFNEKNIRYDFVVIQTI